MTSKTKDPCCSMCDTQKTLLNVMSSKHRSKFTAIHWQSWRLNWYVLSGMGKKNQSINYFTAHSRIFDSYLDVTIAGEGAANLGLYSALKVFEHGGIFLVSHLLWHGASVFPVSSEWPPHSITSYCWWRAGKLRPMLGIQSLWAGKDHYCATYALTRGLSFPSLVQWTSPLTTCKGGAGEIF